MPNEDPRAVSPEQLHRLHSMLATWFESILKAANEGTRKLDPRESATISRWLAAQGVLRYRYDVEQYAQPSADEWAKSQGIELPFTDNATKRPAPALNDDEDSEF